MVAMRARAQFALRQRFMAKGSFEPASTDLMAGRVAVLAALHNGDRALDMALLALSDDAWGIVFEGLCNTLDPRVALALSSVCHGLWVLTQELRRQLRADHRAAAAMCLKLQGALSLKVGMRSCKELREAKKVFSRVTYECAPG